MKVITIKQPWATLIAEGIKKVEFRTWKTNYRGELYIHAGKGIDKKAIEEFKDLNLSYPQGQIIAKCELVDCIKIDKEEKEKLKKENSRIYKNAIENTGKTEYGFLLKNVEKINPISAKGKLSFWEYKKDE